MEFYEENTEVAKYNDAEVLDINLSSAGALSAPVTLRVTDYTMEDTIKLSSATTDNIINLLVEVLQSRVQDDFDVRLLHENEFEEILFSIYANFWNSALVDYPYPYTEEDLELLSKEDAENVKSGKTKLKTDIDLTKLDIVTISEEFKEPIVITLSEKLKIGMRLPRIGDFLLVEEHLKKKYAVQDKKFSDIKFLLENGKDVESFSNDQLIPYIKYDKERAIDFLAFKQAILVQFKIEDGVKVPITTFEEKYHTYKGLPRKLWNTYSKKVEKVKFGVNHDEVEMISPITKKPVIRRCLFQVLDFIPTDAVSDDSGYDVQFGE